MGEEGGEGGEGGDGGKGEGGEAMVLASLFSGAISSAFSHDTVDFGQGANPHKSAERQKQQAVSEQAKADRAVARALELKGGKGAGGGVGGNGRHGGRDFGQGSVGGAGTGAGAGAETGVAGSAATSSGRPYSRFGNESRHLTNEGTGGEGPFS